jgi:ribosomal protein L11 methyltransferase
VRTWPALEVAGGTGWLNDELLQAALVELDVAAVEELPGSWRIFFPTADARDAAIPHLGASFPDSTLTAIDILDEDWAARSQATLKSVQVGDLVIAPPWDVPADSQGRSRPGTIVIQPSMGFGTGHHATTRLCLAALQQIDLDGRSVLDVGTGSGVLAIAASLRGASPVAGIDFDPDAIQAASENLAFNPAATVTFDLADLKAESAVGRADVVFANLTGGLLIQTAARLQDLATRTLVLSGFMTHEEREVMASYATLDLSGRQEEDGWVCVTLSAGTA